MLYVPFKYYASLVNIRNTDGQIIKVLHFILELHFKGTRACLILTKKGTSFGRKCIKILTNS